jgi:two-component system chemotaxis sensor kinase CheA
MVRLVRDLSREGGKRVELSIEAADMEIDRNVAEVLYDPLVHMIRNAVDHGIEPPEVRKKSGKPEHGCVSLKAHEGDDRIEIEVRDDGRGLDRERILWQAKEKGLVGKDDALTDNQVDNLIFHPGLSTSEKVTLVSGRGVGMDIVKRAVEGLGGIVEIQSQPGHGTGFRIHLPQNVRHPGAGALTDESGRPHPVDGV